MRIIKFLKNVRDFIKNPESEFTEKIFIIFCMLSVVSALVALVGDILIGEDPAEIIALIAIVVFVPLIAFVCLYKDRISFAIRFLIAGLVFAIIPALFFFGGGVEGGGVLWIIFAFMYVGLVISGKWRTVVVVMIFAEALIFYLIAYYHPEYMVAHSRKVFYIDSFISLILVGLLCYAMTWFQNRMFSDENERAKKEAERAEELSRAQNRFFSSMSHEIRTPINSILGLNELILRDRTASDEIAKDASGIQGAGKMLLALINDILDFSKMEAGSMDIIPVDYRVGDMLSEIVNMMWLKAEEKGLDFKVSVDPDVPSVLYGDEVRIKQVLINMLNNAVKYTQEGSVELRVESEDIDDDNVMLSVSVSDTGMGIKKEALPYLFDAFKRFDEEKNSHIEGTGLGLSIVKQLIELMGGTITVNSVYGEGSTFSATFKQGISDAEKIGELNIHSQHSLTRKVYEASFKAPDARILIVDDNEMNLEVERKLLADTGMKIDTALSGRDALELSLRIKYDVILMDHLMPEMDGIECLNYLRGQDGGLNRTTPIIVLTANAGSENRELYTRSGFDGYLVKPVSGESLEEILTRHIDKDKLIISDKMMRMHENINTASGYLRKASVIVTSTSMCDLPDAVVKKLNLPIIPFLVKTDEGVFKDGVQMDANELIRYINSGKNAVSTPPDVTAYTDFFAHALRRAHHIIHISLTTSMSDEYKIASEAAKSFDNVTVVNSGTISSATGILVLIACKLARQNIPVEDIVMELESVKHRLMCSFIIDTTEYMVKKGLIDHRVHKIAKTLNLHPCLTFKDDKYGIGGIWAGRAKRAYKRYISKAFPVDIIPDSDVLFITYADVPISTLQWIKEEISKVTYFDKVVFKQSSAAISSNCGPGAFGILYFIKSNKSYNIGSFLEDNTKITPENEEDDSEDFDRMIERKAPNRPSSKVVKELKWYEKIEFIDAETALENSGSEGAFKAVLKIFKDSIRDKISELDGFYYGKHWEDYTIKIHALKSSSKLIGAMDLSDKAQLLENAGKEGNIDYIMSNHESLMREFTGLSNKLDAVFDEGSDNNDTADTESDILQDKPMVDEFVLESVYEGLKESADNMDCDAINEILTELDEYSIPESDKERIDAIRRKAGEYDYDGILEEIKDII